MQIMQKLIKTYSNYNHNKLNNLQSSYTLVKLKAYNRFINYRILTTCLTFNKTKKTLLQYKPKYNTLILKEI